MRNFNDRLASAADAARALPDGDELARALLKLARDVDSYLAEQSERRRGKVAEAFVRWNEFYTSSVEEAYRDGDQQLAIERRKLARIIAADPRWTGGYADILTLIESEPTP